MTLLELFQLLRKHLRLVVALPVGCALIMAVVSFALMGNTYTAQTSMYILANSNTESQSTNYTDLTASQLLANDVATLLQSDRVEADAASSLGSPCMAAERTLNGATPSQGKCWMATCTWLPALVWKPGRKITDVPE